MDWMPSATETVTVLHRKFILHVLTGISPPKTSHLHMPPHLTLSGCTKGSSLSGRSVWASWNYNLIWELRVFIIISDACHTSSSSPERVGEPAGCMLLPSVLAIMPELYPRKNLKIKHTWGTQFIYLNQGHPPNQSSLKILNVRLVPSRIYYHGFGKDDGTYRHYYYDALYLE